MIERRQDDVRGELLGPTTVSGQLWKRGGKCSARISDVRVYERMWMDVRNICQTKMTGQSDIWVLWSGEKELWEVKAGFSA